MVIASYRDLEVYRDSYRMFLQVHKMALKYPDYEKYEIGAQTRRAAMSIPMNIAEGYGKKSSGLEFKRFLTMSLGSCNEVLVLLDMAKDLGYITEQGHKEMVCGYEVLGKRLNTLIHKWKSNI